MPRALTYLTESIQGIQRDQNKDRVFVIQDDRKVLAVLFDGISSAEEAVKGIEIAVEHLRLNHHRLDSSDNFGIGDLMFEAHTKIIEATLKTPLTTYSAIFISGNENLAKTSNLGDSRIYKVTNQYFKQLSQDDNLVHNKNVVTKCLGMVGLDRSDFKEFSVEVDDARFLLCSDGFYSLLEQNLERFYEVLNFKTPAAIKKALADVIKGSNSDDASYILLF